MVWTVRRGSQYRRRAALSGLKNSHKSHRLRAIATGCGSFLVVAAIALMAISPTRAVFAASALGSETGVPGHGVVYGKVVKSNGARVGNVQVNIFHKIRVKKHEVLKRAYRTYTNAKGIYRIAFKEAKTGTWWVQFVMRLSKDKVLKSNFVGLHIKPGRAYKVSAKLLKSEVFAIFPIGSY